MIPFLTTFLSRILFSASCLVILGAFSAQADVYVSSQGHVCSKGRDASDGSKITGAQELAAASFSSKYKERLIAQSFSSQNNMLFYWVVNVSTGTWSVIRETASGTACLTDSGLAWVRNGNSIAAILTPAMIFRITITETGEWIVSVQPTPESPVQNGVDGGSQWEWLAAPKPTGFGI
jgi:hypothetical protein